jgi:hypothetical protein
MQDFIDHVILALQKHDQQMKECIKRISLVERHYPPAKNENRFLYGKLIEKILIRFINSIIPLTELDLNHIHGAEYKNDAQFIDSKICCSIKVVKQSSNIILINNEPSE